MKFRFAIYMMFILSSLVNLFGQQNGEEDLNNMRKMTQVTEEHKLFEKFTGEWRQNFIGYTGEGDQVGSGYIKNDVILGGRYIESVSSIIVSGVQINGKIIIGYNTKQENYFLFGIDDATNFSISAKGQFDPQKNQLEFNGSDYILSLKKEMPFKILITFERENKYTYQMYFGEGKSQKLLFEYACIKNN